MLSSLSISIRMLRNKGDVHALRPIHIYPRVSTTARPAAA